MGPRGRSSQKNKVTGRKGIRGMKKEKRVKGVSRDRSKTEDGKGAKRIHIWRRKGTNP